MVILMDPLGDINVYSRGLQSTKFLCRKYRTITGDTMGDPDSAKSLIHIGDIINLIIGVLVFLVI